VNTNKTNAASNTRVEGQMTDCNIAIIGAGPYGLSIAAYLKGRGVDFRIFGNPMHTWLTQMPRGMQLKSEGFASFLYDPDAAFTLAHYCKERELPYADVGLPVPLDTFASYGLEFQKRYVPSLENKQVISVRPCSAGFEIALDTGERVAARKLVVAVGISHFAYVPPALSALPAEFVSHSSRHHDLDQFKNRNIIVVGAGASALDVAALLHEAGASVQLVARKPKIRFHDPPEKDTPSLWQRFRHPITGIGPGWKLYFYANAPLVFHRMSERFRFDAVRRILGPAPGWFIREKVVGKFPFNLGVNIAEAKVENGKVKLQITDGTGARRTVEGDHVIAATGYRVDLRRLSFLDAQLQAGIRSVDHTPVLSSNFESSCPGLYFVGTSAANSFGPVLRFAYGAKFTAQRISSHLARSVARDSVRNAVANVEALDRG
jgi:thioredoxin reductase